MAAALAAGADGVRVGTRFAAAAEADVHPIYVDALIAARAEDSIYTRTFHVGWPEAPHRVLRSAIEAAEALQRDTVGNVTNIDGTQPAVLRFATTVADRTATGHVDANGALRRPIGRRREAYNAGARNRPGAGQGGRGISTASH